MWCLYAHQIHSYIFVWDIIFKLNKLVSVFHILIFFSVFSNLYYYYFLFSNVLRHSSPSVARLPVSSCPPFLPYRNDSLFYTFFIKMFKFSDYNESTGKTVQFGSFYILCLYRLDMEFICWNSFARVSQGMMMWHIRHYLAARQLNRQQSACICTYIVLIPRECCLSMKILTAFIPCYGYAMLQQKTDG